MWIEQKMGCWRAFVLYSIDDERSVLGAHVAYIKDNCLTVINPQNKYRFSQYFLDEENPTENELRMLSLASGLHINDISFIPDIIVALKLKPHDKRR